jgi:hypothetical protein
LKARRGWGREEEGGRGVKEDVQNKEGEEGVVREESRQRELAGSLVEPRMDPVPTFFVFVVRMWLKKPIQKAALP